MNIKYEDLDKYFISPKRISPFYGYDCRIPRKLKKRMKKWCGVHWSGSTNGQRLWHYLEYRNNNYKTFLIKKIIELYK